MQKIAKHIATLGFVGYFPVAPGTAASLAALGIYFLIGDNATLLFCVVAAALAVGFWSSQVACGEFAVKDPPQIVIDEFAAMLLVYVFLPFKPVFLVAGFVIFRMLDIFKVPFIKKLELLPGGTGIMTDDIAAALITNITLQIARIFIV